MNFSIALCCCMCYLCAHLIDLTRCVSLFYTTTPQRGSVCSGIGFLGRDVHVSHCFIGDRSIGREDRGGQEKRPERKHEGPGMRSTNVSKERNPCSLQLRYFQGRPKYITPTAHLIRVKHHGPLSLLEHEYRPNTAQKNSCLIF
uniref:Secreted protein n=1 Tax=Myripristis murdjan TaxID=586833 RepID=A0A668AAN2_9TELE